MAKEKLILKQPFKGKSAVLTGASTGIGKATAKEIVQLGGSVCIIARRVEVLKEAVKEIEAVKTRADQYVEMISCDTTDMEKLKPLIDDFIKKKGVPDYLINCVGYAMPRYAQDHSLEEFRTQMDTNYYGQLVPILIILPYFMEAKKGYIANVSSMAGYLGLIGYTAYTPTKFAIVGLTEALRHELKPYNIQFSILYPPDTETPAFEKENKTKPEECKIISERGGLLKPEEVAEPFIEGILKNRFEILPGEAKFAWRMFRLLPKLVRNIMDKDLKKARKKLGKE
jgi:3-dehydrosphinganine reductase